MGGKDYIAHSHRIFRDFQGRIIGGILVLQDISSLVKEERTFFRRGLLIASLFLLLAFTVLYFTFGSVMDNLFREMGERRKAESDLALGLQRLQVIFDSSPAAIFIHESDGTLLDLNRTAQKLYGVTREDGLTLSLVDDYSSSENPLEKLLSLIHI